METVKEKEQRLVERILELLETQPESFTARWFSANTIENSVLSKNGKIQIMRSTGFIIKPYQVWMSDEQLEKTKKLVLKIVDLELLRNLDDVIDNLNK